jgi:hypothetical protein
MGVLGRIFRRRRREPDPLEAPAPTPTQTRFERPALTPSLEGRKIGATAGTRSYRAPAGTPSTQRLHNPRHFGR